MKRNNLQAGFLKGLLLGSLLLLLSFAGFAQQNGKARIVRAWHKSQLLQPVLPPQGPYNPKIFTLLDTVCNNRVHLAAVRLVYSRNDRSIKNNWYYQVIYRLIRPRELENVDTLRIGETTNDSTHEQTHIAAKLYRKEQTARQEVDTVQLQILGIDFNRNYLGQDNSTDSIYLELEFYQATDYTFNPQMPFRFDREPIASGVRLFWDYVEGAYEYDLEWVYIDNMDGGFTGQNPFDYKTPVRVTTTNQYYEIPLTYPSGRVYYRVRAVGHYAGGKGRRRGLWNYGNPSDNLVTVVGEDFEKDKTWQAVTTFAEEGKFKKVLSYYDGVMRSRQALTNLSTDQLTLAAESKFDYEGRPVLSILPVPLKGNSLNYRPGLNVFATPGNILGKSNYDNGGAMSAPLDSISGTSRYYSSLNDLNTIHRDYIPAAEGYPYSQVEYENDNTGRVKRQGGVGKIFQLGQGREMRYFYGTPNEVELKRLFGANVGPALRYRKQMIIDPNGQASVAYVDMAGRTIATALAGDTTANLYALDSYPRNAAPIKVNLSANTFRDASDNSRVLSHTILNPYPTSYTFSYDLTGAVTQGMNGEQSACHSCTYWLKISILDPEDKQVYKLDTLIKPSLQCGLAAYAFNKTLNFNKIGNYRIQKELYALDGDLEILRQTVRASQSFRNDSTRILNRYLAAIDTSACSECKTCPADDLDSLIDVVSQGECESILQQIILQQGTDDPAVLKTHKEWPHYQACLTNTRSAAFDKKLDLIAGWNEALAQGYRLDSTFYTHDPFFAPQDTLYGKNSGNTMRQRLSSITGPDGQSKAIHRVVEHPSFYEGLSAAEKNEEKWERFKGWNIRI